MQLFDGVAVQFVTFNAGQLTTTGAEAEWRWNTPLDGLELSGAVAYLDSTFTDTFIGLDGTDLDGRRSQNSPEFSGNIAADYFVPLSDNLELGLSGNATFSSEYFTGINSAVSDIIQDGIVKLDARVSVGDQNGKWTVALVGTNLTNIENIVSAGPRPFLPADGDDQTVTLNRGRQVFAEVSFKF